jgi:hypothetical protein
MITPKLEELIWCGKAFFKTAVVGGSKTTINIDNDRFIIITDILYLPYQWDQSTQANSFPSTQLSIYGERGFNHYMFRNKAIYEGVVFDQNSGIVNSIAAQSVPPQSINTYLIHTTQVGFSFLSMNRIPVSAFGIAAGNNPAYEPPLDYGKDGMTGALNVDISIDTAVGFTNQVVNRQTGIGVGTNITQQIQVQAENAARPQVNGNLYFPIANINYIEVLGQPNNIGL